MSDLNCGKILPPKEGLYQGAFAPDTRYGDQDRVTETSLTEFENISGTEVDIALKFLAFATGLYFPTKEAQTVSDKGGAIFIKLEPWSWKGKNDSSFTLEKLVKGEYDYLLKRFAMGAIKFGKPIFVSFAHEMNGNWYPWSGNPKLYVKAFRHIHDVIQKAGTKNITWVWNPDIFSAAKAYYPGNTYVDWVAIDGYNWSGTDSAASLFNKRLKELKPLGKPIMIGEFACAKNKAACIANFINYTANNNDIKAYIFFNKDVKEKGEMHEFTLKATVEKASYHAAIKKNESLFKSQIRFTPCQVKNAPEPATPEPVVTDPAKNATGIMTLAGPDPELGKEGKWELHRAKVEEKISFSHLRDILLILADIPQTRTLRPDIYKYSGETFEKLYPELSRIKEMELSKGREHPLYWYLRDFRNHWDNTIILFSVYVQKITESTEKDIKIITGKSKDENIKEALEIAEKLRVRIGVQEIADRATGKNRGPSDYSLAALDLIMAEVYSQAKNQDPFFYKEGIRLVTTALDGFIAIEHKESFPSQADYFSITKGILVLADLLQQLGHATADPNKRNNYFEMSSYLYGRIGALKEPEKIEEMGEGLFVNLSEDVLQYLPDAQRQDLASDLPELSHVFFNVPVAEIQSALRFNVDRGYISHSDSLLSEMGIFTLLKGTALIKQAGLFAGWPRGKDPEEYIFHLARVSRGIRQIKLWDQYLVEFHGKKPGELKQKSEFTMTLAGLIQGELLLSLADRIKYFADHEEKWKAMVEEYKLAQDEIKDEDYYRFSGLALLPYMTDEKDKKELADELVKRATEFYFRVHENFTYPYLYAWSKVKQLEVQVRLAEYIKYLDRSGRITDVPEKQAVMFADIAELLMIREAVDPYLGSEDYLRLEVDLITASLLLSGIPVQRDSRFRILNITNKTIEKESKPDEALQLLNEIKAGLGYLPALNQKYFNILLTIKEAQARIQKAKGGKERKAAAVKTLEPLIATAIEIGYGIPTHIYHQIMELDKLIAGPKKDLKEAKSILNVLPDIISALEIDSLSADKKETLTKMKELTKGIKASLNRGRYSAAAAQAKELQEAARKFNDRKAFAKVSEALVWDMHSLKAELFHQIAINFAIRKKNRLIYEFSISAYLECEKSGSNYDRKMRVDDISADTGLTQDEIDDFKRKYGVVR